MRKIYTWKIQALCSPAEKRTIETVNFAAQDHESSSALCWEYAHNKYGEKFDSISFEKVEKEMKGA